MKNSVIVSACRTPIGSFQGSLSPFKAPELGAIVINEAVARANLKPKQIEEVIMGCVITAGLGQNPARQATLLAGLPKNVGALTVNKVCSSGLKAVMLADQSIKTGECGIIVAGGMESMTNAPYLLREARKGYRLGDGKLVDSMIYDGLWDSYDNVHMGLCAEKLSKKNGIGRKEQDDFAIKSYEKILSAQKDGKFKKEIVPVQVPQRKGDPVIFDQDEEPQKINFDKLRKLRPTFDKDGTVTAANASSISDGASAMVVMSEEDALRLGLKPLGKIVAYAGYSQEPKWFTTAPIGATRNVLQKAGLEISDIDLFEMNEAFSVQALAVIEELCLDPERVNVNGGAVAIGHPIGCSGARILTTLLYAMQDRNAKRGLATLCNGGGEATAMIVELI